MFIAGIVLVGIGALIGLIYGIILLIQAFQTSVLWGLGFLFVPFVNLIYVFMHWPQAGGPFLKSLISIPFTAVGMFLLFTSPQFKEAVEQQQSSLQQAPGQY